jgi:alpha-glucosidase
VLLLTLRGTPFLYYGEEIGMRDVRLKYRELRDPYTKRYWPFLKGRDRARTPMQWDATPAAGFTTGTPWLPVSPNWSTVNVVRSQGDSRSLLALYRQLIAIRKASPALTLGTLLCLDEGPANCLIYVRQFCDSSESSETQDRILIAINFSAQMQRFAIGAVRKSGELLLSSDPQRALGPINLDQFVLGPDEAVVVTLR